MSLEKMLNHAATQNNPISILKSFLDEQNRYEKAEIIEDWRFIGYVLDLGFDEARIITSDPYKIAVGGIPRGSFLIMVPNNIETVTPHFTLLRVKGVATTPLSSQVQQTYFELHKKSMPELDRWTQSELQWGALDCDVLGMFYSDPQHVERLVFSGDVNNVVSAHKYKVFSPDECLLDLIVNLLVKENHQARIGSLRTMECQLSALNDKRREIPVYLSMDDFIGCRTAMFGKTRLGKSNAVKLIMQGMLNTYKDSEYIVGQLVFDINGEYANDSDQDEVSIRSANTDRCEVYALTQRPGTPSKELKLNFYETPDSSKEIINSLLKLENKASDYIKNFMSVSLPSIETVKEIENVNEKMRAIRKIQIFWCILHEAGFEVNENALRAIKMFSGNIKPLHPGFSKACQEKVYGEAKIINSLETMCEEYKAFIKYQRQKNEDLKSSSGNNLFDKDDMALLNFLVPTSAIGSGPKILGYYRQYHSKNAGDFIKEIINLLQLGKTVILDLGNANQSIRTYFSDLLSKAIFAEQEKKFTSNDLKGKYIQLYFEEAHNLFPPDSKDNTDIYSRFAKEGAKFHIGMVYSTQSPSTISKELLTQTENFFVGHLSSQDETKALSRLQIAFSGIEGDILRSKTVGYMRIMTLSNRFVIPVQVDLYSPRVS